MPSHIQRLAQRDLIRPPKWLPANIHYEAVMGSTAYGTGDDESDFDVTGWCIPPKQMVFPHLAGEILGFGRQKKRFEQYQQHHVRDEEALGGRGRDYDITIFGIVKYFHLAMENNPNMVDALFAPANCVLHSTAIGERVREKRRIFLHKGCWHRFKGYAYSQLHKMRGKRDRAKGKRRELAEIHGYDVKFATHCVRLLDEVEQILERGDLELGRNREQLKAIRRGEWPEERVRQYFADAEKRLEALYLETKAIPYGPDEQAIKALLVECLEEHYGSLEGAVVDQGRLAVALRQIDGAMDGVRGML